MLNFVSHGASHINLCTILFSKASKSKGGGFIIFSEYYLDINSTNEAIGGSQIFASTA